MLFIPEYDIHLHGLTNFIVEVTQRCNFRCKYCCFSGDYDGMRHHNKYSMSKATALKVIDFICLHAVTEGPLYVSFYGGEALLNPNVIKLIVENLQLRFGNRLIFDISTNGYLLDTNVVNYILTIPNLNISVSIDGIEAIHDKNRLHISGAKTYRKIVNNLLYFKNKNQKEYRKRIRILITAGSLDDISVIDCSFDVLKLLNGDKPILVSHLLPNFSKNILYRDSIESKIAFIKDAIEYKKAGANNLHTLILDELQRKKIQKFKCVDCDTLKLQLHTCVNHLQSCFINIFGEIFPCEKVKPIHSIGDVYSGFDLEKIRTLMIKYSIRRNIMCRNCDYATYCKRCIIDLNFSLAEQQVMCAEYKENIDLALKYSK